MMKTAILSSCYLPPVQYISKLKQYGMVIIDVHEHYIKQTYRNRCNIASASGIQSLTVPVSKGEGTNAMKDMLVSDHGNWRHLHLTALDSSYGNSPFFEYYRDDFAPFYEKKFKFLVDYNLELLRLVCNLMDIDWNIELSDSYIDAGSSSDFDDFRSIITPKGQEGVADSGFVQKEYYQVFKQKYGFIPNLSCVDLLFNMGPESVFYI